MRRLLIALLVALSLSALTISSAGAALEEDGPVADGVNPQPLCEQIPGADIERLQELPENQDVLKAYGDDGAPGPEYLAWLDDEKLQDAADKLGEYIDDRKDVYGVVVDFVEQRFVIVVDRAVEADQLVEIASAAGSIAGDQIAIEVRPGCHSMAEAAGLVARVPDIGFKGATDSNQGASWSYRYDLGRLEVEVPAGAADRLREELPPDDAVVVASDVALSSGSRSSDNSPHWGGSGLNNKWSGQKQCSAGFTVNYGSTSKRAMLSAGHCSWNLNNSIYSGSGSGDYFGAEIAVSTPCSQPGCIDVMVIGSGSHKYENKIHTNPGSPSSRTVTGWRTPRTWYDICVSGQLTGAKCGLTLTASWQNNVCAQIDSQSGACISYLKEIFKAKRTNTTVFQQGDSGGPLYTRLSNSRARIIGLGVANADAASTVLFHSPSSLTSRAGQITGKNITVAITSGAHDSW